MMKRLKTLFGLWFLCSALVQGALASESIRVPFSADRWSTQGDIKFQKLEGFPNGLMESKGSAVLKGLVFSEGSIDLDVIFGGGIATIMFRRGEDEGEVLVLRPQPNCPASNDCIQYTPFINGAYLYDLYPQFQTQAPLSEKGWNHVHIVVSGKRMNVYLNGLSAPVLSVTRMEGNLARGGLRLSGHASWANLVVAPDDTARLSRLATPDLTASDARFVRSWALAASQAVPSIVDKKLDAPLGSLPVIAPAKLLGTRSISAESNGLINLSRAVGSVKANEITGVWLETQILSDRDQVKHVDIGWVREVAVFVNGTSAYVDRNLYGVSALQKTPDGRISLENGHFDMHLHKGSNRIQVFIDDNASGGHAFGWGLKMRFEDVSGIRLQASHRS